MENLVSIMLYEAIEKFWEIRNQKILSDLKKETMIVLSQWWWYQTLSRFLDMSMKRSQVFSDEDYIHYKQNFDTLAETSIEQDNYIKISAERIYDSSHFMFDEKVTLSIWIKREFAKNTYDTFLADTDAKVGIPASLAILDRDQFSWKIMLDYSGHKKWPNMKIHQTLPELDYSHVLNSKYTLDDLQKAHKQMMVTISRIGWVHD